MDVELKERPKIPLTDVEKGFPASTVCVTGATGFIAGHIVDRLLAAGHVVHATCRYVEDDSFVDHLRALPGASEKLKIFKADLMEEGSYDDAVQGCQYVIHTASPCLYNVPKENVMKILVEPAIKGTVNVLGSVNRTPTVKKVIFTASTSALCSDPSEYGQGHVLSEKDWNKTASETYFPYYYSKTVSELKAFEMCGSQKRWKLCTLLPCIVIGPPLSRHTKSESLTTFKKLLLGKMFPMVPDFTFYHVDVRDVAAAHCVAMSKEEVEGRYLMVNTDFPPMTMLTWANVLRMKYPNRWLPFMTAPKWLLWLIGPFVGVSRDLLKARYGRGVAPVDCSRYKRDIGLAYSDPRRSLLEMAEALVQLKMV